MYDGVFTVHDCQRLEESKRTFIEHEESCDFHEEDDEDDDCNVLDENSRILDETSISTRDINSSFINVKKRLDVSSSLTFNNGETSGFLGPGLIR